jgi:hypothetical protein
MMIELAIELSSALTLVDDGFYQQECETELAESGVFVLTIQASGVHDQAGVFRQVADALETPRPAASVEKWSALEDDLWSAICAGGTSSGAIVVRNAGDLLDGALGELLELVDILRMLALRAAGPEGVLETPMDLYLILTGSGSNFPKNL